MLQLNEILHNIRDEETAVQVELAIMQMCHQGINFHAKGFFVINYGTMLQVDTTFGIYIINKLI